MVVRAAKHDDDLGNTTRGKKNKNNNKVKMSDEEEGSDGA